MSVCICVYIYVCTYAHVVVHMWGHAHNVYKCGEGCMYICKYTRVYLHWHTDTPVLFRRIA